MGTEGVMQTSRWGNSGCGGCDWDCGLGCVGLLCSGCFGRAGGQLRAASCQQSFGIFQLPAVLGTLSSTSLDIAVRILTISWADSLLKIPKAGDLTLVNVYSTYLNSNRNEVSYMNFIICICI